MSPLSPGEYVAGVAFLVVTLGASLLAAWLAERRFLALAGAPRLAALGLLTAGAVFAAHLAPGLAGILSAWSAAATAVGLAAVAGLFARRAAVTTPRDPVYPPGAHDNRWSRVAGLACGVAVGGFLLAALYTYARGAAPPSNADALSFHLPGIGRWIQTGELWRTDQFIPGVPTGQYPQNGDVMLLAGVLPWENDAFVRLVNFPFLALVAVALYALGRELGAARGWAAAAAAVALAMPAAYVPVTEAVMADAPLLAGFAVGLLFFVRHLRTGRTAELALAGLGIGIALGTKWYGVPVAVVTVGGWLLAGVIRREGIATVARGAVLPLGVAFAAGGVWMLRNWIESGNPVYPARVEVGGLTVFDAPSLPIIELTAFSLADYAGDWDVWRHYLLDALWGGFRLPGALLVVGGGAGLAAAFRARRRPGSGPVLLTGIIAIGLLAAYALTPGSASGLEGRPVIAEANTRYGVAGFLAAAPVAAWTASRLPPRAAPFAALLALAAVGVGLERGIDPFAGKTAVAAGLLAVIVLAARHPGWRDRLRRPSTPVAAGALAAVLATLFAIGYDSRRRFNDGRYARIDPVFDHVGEHAAAGHRVGIAGTWSLQGYAPTWPMFGPRIENEVAYIGPIVDGALREYGSRAAFTAALEERDPDLLVVGLGSPPAPTVPEEAWATAAGFAEVARSDRLVLLERGPGEASG